MLSRHHKSPIVFFLIVTIIPITAVIYLYANNISSLEENTNVLWEDASIKIVADWGLCPPTFPCYETYLLNLSGNVSHNDELKGRLSQPETKKLIEVALGLYQNNICTPLYDNDIKENYELRIDEKVYQFGGKRGCKEMQIVVDDLKKLI